MTTRQSQTPSQKGRAPKVSPSKATPDATPRDTPRRPTKGPGARAEAARLLAEGFTVSEVARRLGVSRQTVSGWANHTAAEAVSVEKAKRAQGFEDAVADARRELKASTLDAARVLVGQLTNADPAVAAAAAKTILDRSGLPRVEVVHTEAEPLDLSGLTAEELDTFEALLSRVKGGAS